MGTKTQFLLRDFYEVRRPEIHSTLRREEMSRIMGQTNKDFKSRNCIFDKFPSPQTFSCWKVRFRTEVCSCSKFPTEAMLWTKEVEMANSVDDLLFGESHLFPTLCGQNTLTRDTFSTPSSLCTHHIVAQGVARRVCIKRCSCTCHHMSERLLVPCFVFFLCLSCLYFVSLLPVL